MTRRKWIAAAGTLPLQVQVMSAFQLGPGGREGANPGPAPVSCEPGPAAYIAGQSQLSEPQRYLFEFRCNASQGRRRDRPCEGKRRLSTGRTRTRFRPNQRRISTHFAKLINADPDEIAFVPSTQIGESFIAAALGLLRRGAHVVSDELHFSGSQQMYTDMKQRGLEVTWVKMTKDGHIPLDSLDKAIVKGKNQAGGDFRDVVCKWVSA